MHKFWQLFPLLEKLSISSINTCRTVVFHGFKISIGSSSVQQTASLKEHLAHIKQQETDFLAGEGTEIEQSNLPVAYNEEKNVIELQGLKHHHNMTVTC